MLCVPRMCHSEGLQQGYSMAHRALLRRLVPAAARAAAELPPAGSAAYQLCATAYQPAAVILGGPLVAYLAFINERNQRRSFVLRRNGPDQRRLLQAASGLPVRPLDFWLSFGLPLACALGWLHLTVLRLQGSM
ncbi:hypothetical protein ABPG75_000756 [Micractinium tetrahymenae]